MPGSSSGPKCFQASGPGPPRPATGSHVVIRGTPVAPRSSGQSFGSPPPVGAGTTEIPQPALTRWSRLFVLRVFARTRPGVPPCHSGRSTHWHCQVAARSDTHTHAHTHTRTHGGGWGRGGKSERGCKAGVTVSWERNRGKLLKDDKGGILCILNITCNFSSFNALNNCHVLTTLSFTPNPLSLLERINIQIDSVVSGHAPQQHC